MELQGIQVNRSIIDLPPDVSEEIIQKTQESSIVMQLAEETEMPGRGKEIPVITSDPEAAWVGETARKPVSRPGLSKKILTPYKLAVIVPFSDEFKRDAKTLYDAIVKRLPRALAQKFDATCFGNVAAPGNNFDTFANCTAQGIGGTKTYAGLVAADTDIAVHGGILNGYAISPQGKGILLTATDGNDRPLFINNVSEGSVPVILGAKTLLSKAAYKAGTPNIIGVAGDWTQAMYGTVEGVKISIADQATLVEGEGEDQEIFNLFQHNMFAVRAEIELGFRADTSCFNLLTDDAN